MYLLLFALAFQPSCAVTPAAPLTLEVDSECVGGFRKLQPVQTAPARMMLTHGWLDSGFFQLWGAPVREATAPGEHSLDAADCHRHKVTITQTLGEGLRQRQRSWTLLDACPVQWTIEAAAAGKRTVNVRQLTFVAKEIAVAR